MPDYQLVSLRHEHTNETHANVKVGTESVEYNLNLKVVKSYLIGKNTPVWTVNVAGNEILEHYKPVESVNII